jgi:hypothetical protein
MRRSQLPITAIPAWSKLSDASFIDISVQDLGELKGFGLATERALSSKETFDVPTLLIVPHDLILSAEAIEEHAKVDQHFKQLLEVAGGTVRPDLPLLLLFLLRKLADEGAVLEGRYFAVLVDANNHWFAGTWAGRWRLKPLDGICKDSA